MEPQPHPSTPVRRSMRLVLLNGRDELLLMKVALPDRTFWCTIGGGMDAGETPQQAARRELREETGLTDRDVVWGPPVWYGEHRLQRDGVLTLHQETFLLVRTVCTDVSTDRMTEQERQVVKSFKWWSLAALKKTREFVVPPSLVRHLEPLLAGAIPSHTLQIDLGNERRPA
ncbi:NUDIX hydrolase [Caldimonas brevitalea]|uniref:MutT/nudix-family hydrolase n=1 Tax=Caldimonas brevitalea TaxID=413882 RepID=A0A0G3BU54_9BURK|nr:NUDIX domain-containing protein [Caldimonas brevitalea]AKJ30891.1 mutT/nudix-family hydrolase [Caldimonas brevitalea]